MSVFREYLCLIIKIIKLMLISALLKVYLVYDLCAFVKPCSTVSLDGSSICLFALHFYYFLWRDTKVLDMGWCRIIDHIFHFSTRWSKTC